MRWSTIAPRLQTSLGLLLFGFAVAVVVPELSGYVRSGVGQGLALPPWSCWGVAIAATLLSYGAIACYDLLAFIYLGYGLDRRKIYFTGLLTYSLSPSLGFPFLSAGAIRYRFYGSWGVPPLTIAQIIVFSNATLWVGLCGVAGLVLWLYPLPLPPQLTLPLDIAHLGGLGLILTGLYLAVCAVGDRRLPSIPVALGQLLTFALDWGGAAIALYWLLEISPRLAFGPFFGIYSLAMVVGLLSTVPGGLGVLETVMLFF